MALHPLESLAGQVIVAGFPAGEPPPQILDALRADALAGVILFKRNVPDVHATAALNALVRDGEARARPRIVAVDQEGGRVARLGAPVLKLPPMRVLGELDDIALTESLAHTLGKQLRWLGFTLDFAPVLDVDTNPANPVIGDRSFGRDAPRVRRHGVAFARGLARAGIQACGKHFPGHGDTEVDSHLALPRVQHPRERLDAVELAPFGDLEASLVPSLMTAHVLFDALDATRPATLSRAIVGDLLRSQLGYTGVVFSDDLEMKAIADRMPVEESAVLSIDAGCDALLICSQVEWVDRARAALARRADADVAFRRRLGEAVARVAAMRASAAEWRPAPPNLEVELRATSEKAEATLEARLGSLHP